MIKKSRRFAFSGHDSFQCRLMWLKKGYDFLQSGHSFSEDAAGVILGVGNNMVRSIRFWMRAFGVTDEQDQLSDYAKLVFGGTENERALDPFLEDDATLWILHYRLVSTGYASIYSLIFNELRRQKIEFTKNDFLNFVKLKLEERSQSVSENSITEDFTVMLKMYMIGDTGKDIEEGFSGILTELNLLSYFVKQKEDAKKESENVYYIEPSRRDEIPDVAVIYAILENGDYENSINFNQLETDENSPGSVFAMTREGLGIKLKRISEEYDFVTLSEQSGVRELQFKRKPTSAEILTQYYAGQERYQTV